MLKFCTKWVHHQKKYNTEIVHLWLVDSESKRFRQKLEKCLHVLGLLECNGNCIYNSISYLSVSSQKIRNVLLFIGISSNMCAYELLKFKWEVNDIVGKSWDIKPSTFSEFVSVSSKPGRKAHPRIFTHTTILVSSLIIFSPFIGIMLCSYYFFILLTHATVFRISRRKPGTFICNVTNLLNYQKSLTL